MQDDYIMAIEVQEDTSHPHTHTDTQPVMSSQKHIVIYPMPVWGACLYLLLTSSVIGTKVVVHPVCIGHSRPLVNLAAWLVKLRPVSVTILATNELFDRMSKELARSFDASDDEVSKRVR